MIEARFRKIKGLKLVRDAKLRRGRLYIVLGSGKDSRESQLVLRSMRQWEEGLQVQGTREG